MFEAFVFTTAESTNEKKQCCVRKTLVNVVCIEHNNLYKKARETLT